ncbi:hypothetical protein BDV95DRAFT_604399 [Massariosphaeria phaeospora]|uniref:RRM domain-containing protein n=1 Tax=Massariosphaeria phaeospora TaxID=100035 RepID=A0A7C8IJ88_9PLEO|nr:hypothetical protein BDV95DRAFT_604399 [Massariosphaeria phaeospora]
MAPNASEVENLFAEVEKELQEKSPASDSPKNSGDDRRSRGSDRRDGEPLRGGRERRRDSSRPRLDASKDEKLPDWRHNSSESYRGSFGGREGDRRGRGDFYIPRRNGRSRSPRRDRPDRYRDRRHNSRDRNRDRRSSRERLRDSDRPPKPRREATPEVSEDDRDKRTVFVQQISQRAETRHLRQFFEAVGPVIEAQIVKDRVTGRSKGVGYVEFKQEESVAQAIELTGQKLKGVPIIVQLTEAEKNRASRATNGAAAATAGANGSPFHRLFIGNIHFSVSEDDLNAVFAPFGEVEQIFLQREEAGNRSKGYGWIQYAKPQAAKEALQSMNAFELAGRQIRVGLGSDKFTPESTATLLRNFEQQAQSFQGSAFSGAGGRGAHAGGSGGVYDRSHGRDDRGVGGASALDDTDVAGVNFKTVDRTKLMNALARTDEPVQKGAQLISKPRVPVVDKPMPSRCIKIENAFDPAEEYKEYGDSWAKDLEGEVKIECDKKYGKIGHIAVDPNSEGDVYVKFKEISSGEKALQGLNGRGFNHRTIRASYVVDTIYNSLYAAAAKV